MSDETSQPNIELTQTSTENQNSEPNSIPVSPDEPTTEAPIPPVDSQPTEVLPVTPEASQNAPDAIPVKDDIPANEPFPVKDEVSLSHGASESAPVPEIPSEPNGPNITVEKHGNDVTITEVIEPAAPDATEAMPSKHSELATAQMAGNEPLPASTADSGEAKDKQRKENLKLANEKRQSKKREKINEVLDLFVKQTNLTNDEVEKLLHVSDATATRYLETLEKEGKIKQVGKTGKGVSYTKI